MPALKNGTYEELFNSVAEFFAEVIAYIEKVLAAFESKFGFEEMYENSELTLGE